MLQALTDLKNSNFNPLKDRICLQNSLGGGGGGKPILSHPSIILLVRLLRGANDLASQPSG